MLVARGKKENMDPTSTQKTVGARCAVFFHRQLDCFSKQWRKGASSWILGTIHALPKAKDSSGNNKMTVRFDDHRLESIPKASVQLLRQVGNQYLTTIKNESVVIAELAPNKLCVGDLVLCLFQNGHVHDTPLAWYRARVAKVTTSSYCDLAYDDGDYEKDVPFGDPSHDHIVLLERGKDRKDWLVGLQVSVRQKRKGKTGPKGGVVKTVNPDGTLQVEFHHGNDDRWEKKVNYNALVNETLFDNVNFGTEYCWRPDRKVIAPTKNDTRLAKVHATVKRQSTAKPSRKRKTHAPPLEDDESPVKDEEDDDDDCSVESATTPPKSRKRSTQTATKGTLRRAARKQPHSQESEDDVAAVAEVVAALSLDTELPEPALRTTPLDSTLANPFGDALHSCDPDVGVTLLQFALTWHAKVPGAGLWEKLLDLLLFGPACRKVKIPDPYKMDLVHCYMGQLFETRGLLQSCIKHIDSNRNQFFDLFLQQLLSSYYLADGDEERQTDLAHHRIHATMHAKACLADGVARLLRHLLLPAIVNGSDYKTLPIIHEILCSRRGSKNALEQVVEAWVEVWTRFGHLVQQANPHEQCSLIVADMLELSNHLGSIISYLAWLYGREASENAESVADVISTAVYRTNGDLAAKAKLNLILSLKKEVIPQVRPKLAERLNVAKLYNICFA